jgi:lipoyl(octanoyl) transferase
LPNGHPLVAGTIIDSYRRISAALLRALERLGMTASADPQAKHDRNAQGPVCFEVPSSYEIAAEGKKMLGSAQVRKYEGTLQHGTLPLSGDLSRICDALCFEDETKRQYAKARVLARAITLETALGKIISWDAAAYAMIDAFAETFDLAFERSTLSSDEQRLADELRHTRYAAADWTLRV